MEGPVPNQQIDDHRTLVPERLHRLEIEIVQRKSPDADAKQISINMKAVSSRHLGAPSDSRPICIFGAGCADRVVRGAPRALHAARERSIATKD